MRGSRFPFGMPLGWYPVAWSADPFYPNKYTPAGIFGFVRRWCTAE